MATKDITGTNRDMMDCVNSAHVNHCTLEGVLSLLDDEDIIAHLGQRHCDNEPDVLSKFMAIKIAFDATLKALYVDLNEVGRLADLAKLRRVA